MWNDIQIPGRWAAREARKALTVVGREKLPVAETVGKLEWLLRNRVQTVAFPLAVRRAQRLRAAVFAAPAVLALGAPVVMALTGGTTENVVSGAMAWGVAGLALQLLYFLTDMHEKPGARVGEWLEAARAIPAKDLLEPFGGVDALPVRFLVKAGKAGDTLPRNAGMEPSLQMELQWRYAQLDPNERRVIDAQGSSDIAVRDVLAAYRVCVPAEQGFTEVETAGDGDHQEAAAADAQTGAVA